MQLHSFSALHQASTPAGAAPRGTVVLVHGLGEHSGRYAHVTQFLNGQGYNVFVGDLPGFGRSPGRRGHIESFGEYIDVVAGWVADAKLTTGSLPLYLMGHSLGGLIALRCAQELGTDVGLAGLILSSPCLRLKTAVPAWKVKLANALDGLAPKLSMWNEVQAEHLSHDPEVVQAYRSDPLNYTKVTVRWYRELMRGMAAAASATIPSLPILVLLAESDKLVDAEWVGSQLSNLPNVSLRSYPGMYHETLNEPGKAAVLDAMGSWLGDRPLAAALQ